MARLHTAGAEWRTFPTVEAEAGLDGVGAGTTVPTASTTTPRTGSACYQFVGHASNTSYVYFPLTGVALGTTIFVRAYVQPEALPAAAKRILAIHGGAAGATPLVSVRLNANGTLALWNEVGAAQIGSSSADALDVGLYSRVEFAVTIGTGAVDYAEGLLLAAWGDPDSDGTSFASTSGVSISDAVPTQVRCGALDALGAGVDVRMDDIAVNDSTGTAQNSWAGSGGIVVARPSTTPAFSSWTNWLSCTGSGGTNPGLATSLAAAPPAGHATATGHGTDHQRVTSTAGPVTGQVTTRAWANYGVIGNSGYEGTAATINRLDATKQIHAQGFFLTGALDYVEIKILRFGAPTDDVFLELRNDDGTGNKPTGAGTALLTSDPVNTTNMDAVTAQWYKFTFPTSYALTTGVKYWLVVQRTGAVDATNTVQLNAGASLGERLFAYWNGTTWFTQANNILYRAFTTAGVSEFMVVQAACCHAEGVATGTKTGTIGCSANPVIADASFTVGGDVGAGGAYPTNWRWSTTAVSYNPTIRYADDTPRIKVVKTDSGTREVMVCSLGVVAEVRTPVPMWRQYTKTADSTLWWAIRQSATTIVTWTNTGVETTITVQAGDWLLQPDPLPGDEGESTFSTVADATFRTDYTAV